MTTIGSAGKLDVATMVAQLVAAERAPTDARFDRTERQLTAQVSAIGTLRSAFSSLDGALAKLSDPDAALARKVTLPPEANFTASAAAGAAPGRYGIEVLALATAQKLSSGAFAADAAIGTGQLTIGAGETTLTIDIDENNNTLAGIRDAINVAAGGKTVTASIVTGDDGQHLVLNAVDTGSAGALIVTASGGDGGLAAITRDAQGNGGLSELVAAADARVKVDGIERTSSSNTLGDVIGGISLTLTKAEPGVSRELVVAADNGAQRSAAKGFVSAYNAALSAIAGTTSYNTTTKVAAALNGDSMVRNTSRELRETLSSHVAELKALGISIGKDGTLALDEAAFDAAIVADPGAAARLFGEGAADNITGRLDATLNRLLDDDGLLDVRSDSLQVRTKALDAQRNALDFRMSQAESRYRTQFTALDVMLTSLQSSSDFLTQQLAAANNKNSD